MNPTLGLAIMLNNYLHDVATAMLAASGVALWVIIKKYEDFMSQHKEAAPALLTEYFLNIYKSMTRVARFSLYWILIGGIPRTLAYRSFEWSNAVGHSQIPALIIEHVLAFGFVGTGVYLWVKVNKRVKAVRGANFK